jgi:ligand-binding SRPBCC domain-containing protein
MKRYYFESEQHLARPLVEVFAFFADPLNLETITPPWLRFAIIPPGPVELGRGALIDYRLRLRGFPLRWQSEITAWQPPRRFVDEQRRGPYRLWIHEHTFESRGNGTLARDRVEYALYGGLLVRKWVRCDLERIFEFRRRKLAGLFGSPR